MCTKLVCSQVGNVSVAETSMDFVVSSPFALCTSSRALHDLFMLLGSLSLHDLFMLFGFLKSLQYLICVIWDYSNVFSAMDLPCVNQVGESCFAGYA